MRLDDLAIFVEVARASGLRRAAQTLNMQPGTVSKVIKRIESHYQQELFERQGSQWALTSVGETLFHRAIEMLSISDKIERELGKPRRPHLRVSGSESLLAHFVPTLMARLSQQQLTLETRQSEDLSMLTKHEVDLALVTSLQGTQPQDRQVEYQALQEITFVTVTSGEHPLLKAHGTQLAIEQVLEYPFVIPSKPIYGKMATNRSLDGWYDEEFNRRIMARVDTTSMLLSLVKSQPLLAYIPDYLAKEHNLQILEVSGCPYTCEQTVWLCRNKHLSAHWMQVFE